MSTCKYDLAVQNLCVLQFMTMLAAVYAGTTGNGITSGCTQATSCPTGCYGTGNAICYQCGIGFYKAITGTSSCIACASNSGSGCSRCTAGTGCACNVGYTGPNGGTCTACVAGTVKPITGTATCAGCVAGTYSATAASTCAACAAGTYSATSASTCTACAAGTYSATTAATTASTCTACAAGTYSATAASTCTLCHDFATSPISSTAKAACTCTVGYTGPDSSGPCTACVAGTYKDTTGTVACTTCPAHSSSPSASVALTACTCNPGYTGANGGACAACVAGKYKSGTGSDACTSCPLGTYSATAGASTASACTNCGVGHFCNTTAATTALTCPANSGDSCVTCDSVYCPCNAGYAGGNFISPYGGPACARFIAVTPQPSFASVATRNNAGVGSGSMPTYVPTGGPNGHGHVNFNRDLRQFLDSGPRTFSFNTNGGFTMVFVIRFTAYNLGCMDDYGYDGTFCGASEAETIFDIFDGIVHFQVQRPRFYGHLELSTFNVNQEYQTIFSNWFASGMYVPGRWSTAKISYKSSEALLHLGFDDMNFVTTPYAPVQDVGSANVRLGCQEENFNEFFHGDIAGFFFVDEYMTDAAMTAIAAEMTGGVDLTDTTCPGNACTAVVSDGCSAGYTGPNSSTCTACPAGKYKDTTGSAACVACAGAALTGGTYSNIAGAANCTACPDNTVSANLTASTSCICTKGYYIR